MVSRADKLTGWAVIIHQLLLKLFLLTQVKSDFHESWYEWYDGKPGKELQIYRAGFEYLHKLC